MFLRKELQRLMKKYLSKLLLSIFISTLFNYHIFAGTVITAPIDARPISTDYLGNLVKISGDEFICADYENLDYFAADNLGNKFADSKKVRDNIKEIVQKNNNSDTVVILNTSSYMTGGLVGSRCGENYVDYKDAVDDLTELVSQNTNPSYYVNLAMPRTLPETRLNKIWRDDQKIRGLGYYYLKYNDNNLDDDVKSYIRNKLYKVNPIQFIMEWSYVENKKSELGEESLTNWEKDFLKVFNNEYKSYEPYRSFLYKYKLPYKSVADIFYKLVKLQNKGLIDEIIISNDDFQLPDFILYIYNNTNDNWINTENGTPIKYSFARSYMSTYCNSINNQMTNYLGETETNKSLIGKGKNINFIFGMDEVPQLIYARALSQKNNLTSDFKIKTYTNNDKKVDTFDVVNKNELLKSAVNFVKSDSKKTSKKTDIFMYDYDGSTESKVNKATSDMNDKYNSGNNVSLIEIYNSNTLNTSNNALFKKLSDVTVSQSSLNISDVTASQSSLNASNAAVSQSGLNISDLSAYSAWNTNANAIGLGVAHSQVYGINEQISEDKEKFIKAHINMLAQHLIEDGIYTVKGKRLLSNEGFIPNEEDLEYSQKLYDVLQPEDILYLLENKQYIVGDETIDINSIEVNQCRFPWRRTFECFIDFDVK